jgi:hypothetical protein
MVALYSYLRMACWRRLTWLNPQLTAGHRNCLLWELPDQGEIVRYLAAGLEDLSTPPHRTTWFQSNHSFCSGKCLASAAFAAVGLYEPPRCTFHTLAVHPQDGSRRWDSVFTQEMPFHKENIEACSCSFGGRKAGSPCNAAHVLMLLTSPPSVAVCKALRQNAPSTPQNPRNRHYKLRRQEMVFLGLLVASPRAELEDFLHMNTFSSFPTSNSCMLMSASRIGERTDPQVMRYENSYPSSRLKTTERQQWPGIHRRCHEPRSMNMASAGPWDGHWNAPATTPERREYGAWK